MSNTNEGAPAPESMEAKVLAELEKEGHVITTGQPDAIDGEIKDTPAPSKEEPKIEEKPKEEPKAPAKEEPKPDRLPTMVEAWKLEVATKQNEKHQKEVAELSAKIEEMSKQKVPVTQAQKEVLAEERRALADSLNVTVEQVDKLLEVTSKHVEAKYKPSADTEKVLKTLQDERDLNVQLNQYSEEFEKDVAPLVKDYQLSDTALKDLKSTLKDYAFSETYAKVPLKEIFAIKLASLNLTVPKKSSEGKGVKARANEVVDFDNMDEEAFSKLTPDQVIAFSERGNSGWNRPQARK